MSKREAGTQVLLSKRNLPGILKKNQDYQVYPVLRPGIQVTIAFHCELATEISYILAICNIFVFY